MGSIAVGILTGLFCDVAFRPYVQEVKAETKVEEPRVEGKDFIIKVVINWTPERIEQEIRTTFPEAPNTAVAIAKCESGLKPDQVGNITPDYGLMQIHGPSWDAKAKELGYSNYKTDVQDNLKMARHIYDGRGNFNDWVCYTKGMYKKYL